MTILIFARHMKLRNLGLLVDILLFLNVVNHFLPRYRTVSQYLCRCDALFRSYRVIDQIHYMAALTEKDVMDLWCNATAWYIFSCIERNLFYHCSIMITHVPLIYDHISGYQGHQSTWSHCNFHLRLRVLLCHLPAPVLLIYQPNSKIPGMSCFPESKKIMVSIDILLLQLIKKIIHYYCIAHHSNSLAIVLARALHLLHPFPLHACSH